MYGFCSCNEDNLGPIDNLMETKGIDESVLRESGMVLIRYGGDNDVNPHWWILGISESLTDNGMAHPTYLGQCIVAKREWHAQLRKFCRSMKIRFRKPQWNVGAGPYP